MGDKSTVLTVASPPLLCLTNRRISPPSPSFQFGFKYKIVVSFRTSLLSQTALSTWRGYCDPLVVTANLELKTALANWYLAVRDWAFKAVGKVCNNAPFYLSSCKAKMSLFLADVPLTTKAKTMHWFRIIISSTHVLLTHNVGDQIWGRVVMPSVNRFSVVHTLLVHSLYFVAMMYFGMGWDVMPLFSQSYSLWP